MTLNALAANVIAQDLSGQNPLEGLKTGGIIRLGAACKER